MTEGLGTPPVPVLWVSGAPDVGKSTAGWGLYQRMAADGHPVAFVDVDQLGLFGPEPPDDPDRHRLKAANAVETLTNFARHGAGQLIVTGVVDPRRGIDPWLRRAEDLEVTLVRLRADWDELRRRYVGRGFGVERLGELKTLADAADRYNAGTALDVTTMTPEEVTDAMYGVIGGVRTSALPAAAPACAAPAATDQNAPVLLITGPTAVGKSTIGWNVLGAQWGRGLPSAYIDVDQLGSISMGDTRQLKAENTGSVWRGYRAAGARCLVVVARDAPGAFDHCFENQQVLSVQLNAAPGELADRVARCAARRRPSSRGRLIACSAPLVTEGDHRPGRRCTVPAVSAPPDTAGAGRGALGSRRPGR